MSKRRKRRKGKGRKRGLPGCGIGAHQEVSPMARGTKTLSREGKQRKADRKRKQQGWYNESEI